MVSIKDVAKYANVSVATVSRVLNNKDTVSEGTEKIVKEAIEALNYRPNLVARTLYKKRSSMIGLILPDITNPFFPALARAIEDKALSYGFTVILCNADGNAKKEMDYIKSLEQKYIDGFIISTSQLEVENYDQFDFPVVALDRFIKNEIPTVMANNEEGAFKATKHLMEVNCKLIAHVRGPSGVGPADDREKGFLKAVKESTIKYTIVETDYDLYTAEKVAYQLLQNNPEIDGIFAGSDLIAAGVMRAANHVGLLIPHDLQIVGFDGIQLGKMLSPSLTTIEQPIYEMGAMAVELLYKQIEKLDLEKLHYKFSTKLIKGETTKNTRGFINE
ncbi:LacI family DNA-binding transcriptional regulator [Virgibacillus sp. C22-A2]|uniref:LacI family DNA-binding transcriptional regulator n=1 Tax=Virgibacillus tibetensis TaxID=3042313 RepID=A0ABU6KJ67_9BACI|nr:LacI family DNA-binding transcriptional regulator [Virgibacillus sp. C22-A2]